jgi:NADPH:quinone reductase-like Zn-dependent oxidoreductase
MPPQEWIGLQLKSNKGMDMKMMKAMVIHEPGGPKVLKIESLPIPVPKPGHILIRVKAFGINRSETSQGLPDLPCKAPACPTITSMLP